jgi:Ni2+-binding GTPase involved in maturation of urease and hydrogenase
MKKALEEGLTNHYNYISPAVFYGITRDVYSALQPGFSVRDYKIKFIEFVHKTKITDNSKQTTSFTQLKSKVIEELETEFNSVDILVIENAVENAINKIHANYNAIELKNYARRYLIL